MGVVNNMPTVCKKPFGRPSDKNRKKFIVNKFRSVQIKKAIMSEELYLYQFSRPTEEV